MPSDMPMSQNSSKDDSLKSKISYGLNDWKKNLKSLNTNQKYSLALISFLVLVGLPLATYMSLQVTRTRSRAQNPVTPVTPPNLTSSPVPTGATQTPPPPEPTTLTSPTPTVPNPPTTTPTPVISEGRRIFITSKSYDANLGGLSGADEICRTHARNAKLLGTWKAWLSDSSTSASARLEHSPEPYVRMDGAQIASNWEDLTDGSIDTTINYDEYGIPYSSSYFYAKIWTNTTASGDIASTSSSAHCNNWTSDSASIGNGIAGVYIRTDQQWTQDGSDPCSVTNTNRLYCVEQGGDITTSPTPTSSPITPTPTVEPTPVPNNNTPSILTRRVPSGRVNRRYKTIITGIDTDTSDSLSMEVNNLPAGLEVVGCSQRTFFIWTWIRCNILGIPQEAGSYNVQAIIRDNYGATSSKDFDLLIRQANRGFFSRF